MESIKCILFVLIFLSSPIFLVAYSDKKKTLSDLRRFKVEGVAGRFIVDRNALERKLQKRQLQDVACGQDVKILLPRSLPHAPYNTSHQGEVAFAHCSITDHTLAAELSNDIKEQVAISYSLFSVVIPLVLGEKEKHGVLPLHVLTNSTKKVLPPYFTNYKDITYVNSIEEKDDGTVTIRLGDDVMVYWVQEVKSKDHNKVGEDFDKVFGEVIANTKYPLPFDWGWMMESIKCVLFVLISLSSPIFLVACSNKQNTLTDLRRFKVEGVAARFTVDRNALEREIQNRKQQDVACGQEVKLQLPQSLPHASYNTSQQGEVLLISVIKRDHTLAEQLSNDLKAQVATSYRSFAVLIPVVLGMTEKHGLLTLHIFTNSTKRVFDPYVTNYKDVTHVDSIDEENDGKVTIRLGDDVIVYQVQDEVKCKRENEVVKDIDKTNGKLSTNYPLPFDWGCELVGSQISFRQVLNEVRCELAAVGGDVCTLTSTSSSEESPSSVKIVNMTGIFQQMIPFLEETIPNESFEADSKAWKNILLSLRKMESTRLILSVLLSLTSPIFLVANLNEQKTLTDLRRFKVEAVAARFTVDRRALERELRNRKQRDVACGQVYRLAQKNISSLCNTLFFYCLDVKILLPRSLPQAPYNTSHQGEVAFMYGSITDHTLAAELSNDMKEHVATSYILFSVGIPVVLGAQEKHGLFAVQMLTNSSRKVFSSYSTNYKEMTYVDSIEEKDDGTVTIRLGDDVMVYWVQKEVKYKDQNKVGKDFDKVFGEVIANTNYPLPFDWGCKFWGSHTSFCQALNEVQCELTAVGGDVCALTSTSSSERLPITTKFVNMTGIFRDMFPFLAETIPTEGFEAELAEREHTTGITFPCLSS
ncbi:hypothetical protein HOLleu_13749 [Holothuria leucospilota]|uniref:Uncharacterized protein n=1 Tax=Holothuria leucospilota TaxID=206669 RepID=A0A9Q1C6L9_HOLLE|nr:hypothetical protein HOLleu_13749 [Holothuria leucospilota]